MCGEHSDAALMIAPRSGSSPHVRGAHGEALVRDFEVGIIPACAGSTSMSAAYLSLSRDHPRMCGEHWRSLGRFALRVGIIPACAGSTLLYVQHVVKLRDHPRMCGEHSGSCPLPAPSAGSSPHVRGAPVGAADGGFHGGIIPACAGSTKRTELSLLRSGDHPRMCGEHNIVFVPYNLYRGSSPHVRGARIWNYGTRHASGIIPACAGSTSD